MQTQAKRSRTYKVADHSAIVCGPTCPPHITTQSDRLYGLLGSARAKVYLQRCKAAYGADWGFDEPIEVF